MTASVLIVGQGILADNVHKLLDVADWCTVTCDPGFLLARSEGTQVSRFDLALVLDDTWDPSTHVAAENMFHRLSIPWLRGFVRFGQSVIGPLVYPGHPGCSQCADWRLLMAEDHRREMMQLRMQLSVNGGVHRDVFASRVGLWQTATVLVAEVKQILSATPVSASQASNAQASAMPDQQAGTTLLNQVVLLHLRTLQLSRHYILPHATCTFCGTLPDDSKELAVIAMEPVVKAGINQFRSKSLMDMEQILVQDYLDNRTGLFNEKVQDLITPLAAVSVNLPLLVGDEGTSGRSRSYPECEPIAILEGLERYCGIEPRGKRAVVFDSYVNLRTEALNPAHLGLHSPEQYALPNFPFRPFDKNRAMDWVWGYSLTKDRPVLLPKRIAYYSLGCSDGFVYETSNGCALGGSLVEAIFHGVLEVVERDAFLMTWYAQLPLSTIDLSGHPDKELQWMIERIRNVAGYDLYFYNATMENRIPSVFVIAKNKRSRGLNLLCSAGSHINPLRAIKGALHETAGMLLRFDDKIETEKETYREMLKDSARVSQMEDHSMLYGLPEAMGRLRFLLDPERSVQTFAQAFSWHQEHLDLAADLGDLLVTFQHLKMDVVVVNQTSPEIARNGLHCVKVIIPGMLPMTFGHHFRRLENLNRVFTVPAALGFTKRPLSPAELNPYPHPFP